MQTSCALITAAFVSARLGSFFKASLVTCPT